MLNVGLREQVREGGGVMRVHRRHVSVEKRAPDGFRVGHWGTVSGRENGMPRSCEQHCAQRAESKHMTPTWHVCAFLRCQLLYIVTLCLVLLGVKSFRVDGGRCSCGCPTLARARQERRLERTYHPDPRRQYRARSGVWYRPLSRARIHESASGASTPP